MAVIDASVWIARYKTDDKFHEQAKQIIQSLIANQEKVCIPAIAFTEVAGAIKRTTKDSAFASGVILSMKDTEPEVFADFGTLEPIATKIAIHHCIRGADAYYLAVAEITRSNLYTFDKQQQEAFNAISKTWE
ncbi:MAG: type II toxin-antitoxin system VapC family toxin [Planctomycetaceae bacterium]|jgi:predicted nucleic acid-binding protein|nr:type II toxin-antitoxin system VapC family toxin [Planctomycetaceae bacterium]